MFLINTVLIVFCELPLNIATGGWPHQRMLALGAFLTALGFGGLTFATDAFGVAATIVLWTFGEMILMPGSVAYVADISPPNRRGSYLGAYHAIFSVAFGLGLWIGTILLDQYGAAVVWSSAFCVGALSTALLSRVSTPSNR
jgi:predicted MFS family arabinose efflux permease